MTDLMPDRCLRAIHQIKSLLLHARTDAIDLVERIHRITDAALLPDAIADTHAKRGDAKQAPSVMSGGGAEGNRP